MGLGAGNGRNPAHPPLAREEVVRELTYIARIFSADEAPGMRWRRKVSKLSDVPRVLAPRQDGLPKRPTRRFCPRLLAAISTAPACR